ncbi:MAG: hypothetical protein HFJ50_07370 [Clostridia bacterium]|jgi:hypothetical protein|nr:hypothetical protein [Clostridia bacterium]
MNKELEKIADMLPPKNNNYNYLKKIRIGYPVYKINIKILRREDKEVPYSYEVILRLLFENINNIKQISGILGLEEYVVRNILAEMYARDYVYLIGNNPVISIQGKKLLNTLKMMEITEDKFTIYIDGISGKVEIDENVQKGTNGNLLKELIKVDNDFLNEKFADIDDLYKKYQEEEFDGFKNASIYELYDIKEIQSKTILYRYKDVYIFENNGQIDFSFKNKIDNEGEYIEALANEYKNKPMILDIKQIEGKRVTVDNLNEYREELNKNKMLMVENARIKDENEFNKMYYSNRELLEDEYIEFVLKGLDKCKGNIYIKTGNFNEFVEIDDIKSKVIDLLNNGHKIIVQLGKNGTKKDIEKEIKALKLKGLILVNTNNYINERVVIFDSLYMLYTNYEYINVKSDIPNLKIKNEINSIVYKDDIINIIKKDFENI